MTYSTTAVGGGSRSPQKKNTNKKEREKRLKIKMANFLISWMFSLLILLTEV